MNAYFFQAMYRMVACLGSAKTRCGTFRYIIDSFYDIWPVPLVEWLDASSVKHVTWAQAPCPVYKQFQFKSTRNL